MRNKTCNKWSKEKLLLLGHKTQGIKGIAMAFISKIFL